MAKTKKKTKKKERLYQTVNAVEPGSRRKLMIVFGYRKGEPVGILFLGRHPRTRSSTAGSVVLTRKFLQNALTFGWTGTVKP